MRNFVMLCGAAGLCLAGWPAFAVSTFRVFSPAAAKCLALADPNQGDGGGLALRDCRNFADFFLSVEPSTTQIIFELTSRRAVCVFATDTPAVSPGGERAPVQTRDCGNLVGSIWRLRGEDEAGLRQVEKLQANGLDGTNFCIQANVAAGTVELDVCQGAPEQGWRFEPIRFPPLPD